MKLTYSKIEPDSTGPFKLRRTAVELSFRDTDNETKRAELGRITNVVVTTGGREIVVPKYWRFEPSANFSTAPKVTRPDWDGSAWDATISGIEGETKQEVRAELEARLFVALIGTREPAKGGGSIS